MARDPNKIAQTKASLERLQNFDASSFERHKLAEALELKKAIPSAERVLELYRAIRPEILDELSNGKLDEIKGKADVTSTLLGQLESLSVGGNPTQQRDQAIASLDNLYDGVFDALAVPIAYSSRHAVDFSRLERAAADAVQAAQAHADNSKKQLEQAKMEMDGLLAAARQAAAEQGVSQQAIFFKNEADRHEKDASKWLGRAAWMAVVAATWALTYLVPIPWGLPLAEAILGRALVFAVLATFLVVAIRSYTAHQHNAVISRHRQNSLATYTALVEAGGDKANKDVVLSKAADSIFGSQPSGFTPPEGEHPAMAMVNMAASLAKKD